MVSIKSIPKKLIDDKFSRILSKSYTKRGMTFEKDGSFKKLFDLWNTTGRKHYGMDDRQIVNAVKEFALERLKTVSTHKDQHENVADIPLLFNEMKKFHQKNGQQVNIKRVNELVNVCKVKLYTPRPNADKKSKFTLVRDINGDDMRFSLIICPSTFAFSRDVMEQVKELGNEINAYENKGIFEKAFAEILAQVKSSRRHFLLSYNELAVIKFVHWSERITNVEQQAIRNRIFHQTNKPLYFLRMLLATDADNNFLSSDYLKYDVKTVAKSFKELVSFKYNGYLRENFHPNSCLLTAIIQCFTSYFAGKKMKIPTYQNLCEIMKLKYKPCNIKCSIEQALPFFEKYQLGLKVFSKTMKLIFHLPSGEKRPTMYSIIDGDHIYLINNNNKKIEKLEAEVLEIKEKAPAKPPRDYQLPKEEDCEVEYVILKDSEKKDRTHKQLKEILNKIKEYSTSEKDVKLRFITYNVKKILIELYKQNFSVRASFKDQTIVSCSFSINTEDITISVSISFPLQDDEGIENEQPINVDTAENYKKMLAQKFKLESKLLNKKYLSHYNDYTSEIEELNPIGALNITFQEDVIHELEGLDMRKAYPTVLRELKKLPIFEYFDVYQKYDDHPIEDLTIYYVYSASIYARHEYSRQFGFMLKLFKSDEFKILNFRRPSKIIKCDFKPILDEVFASDLPDAMKKDVCNVTIGKLRRSQQQQTRTYIFKDECEALAHCSMYGEFAQVEKITDENLTIFVVNITTTSQLLSGFRNFNELIVSKCSAKAIEICNKLRENDVEVIGIKTDCIIYKNNSGWGLEENDYIEKNFNFGSGMGQYRIEKDKSNEKLTFKIGANTRMNIIDLSIAEQKSFTRDEEWKEDSKTIVEACKEYESILVLAWRPGAGKSTICKRLGKGRVLFVSPTNALCDEIIAGGFDAITIHSLLGRSVDDVSLDTAKFDVSEYQTIVFDEILQTSESLRLEIVRFMENHYDKFYIANGDARQLISIKDKEMQGEMGVCDADIDEYRVKCLNVMFPKQIYFSCIKRGETEQDCIDLENISDDILRLKNKQHLLFDLLADKYKIPVITQMKQVETMRNLTFYRNTRKTINNHWAKKIGRKDGSLSDQVLVDDVVVGATYHKFKTFKIKTGLKYIVVEKKKDSIVIVNFHAKRAFDAGKGAEPVKMEVCNNIFSDKLMFPYAQTIDSCQGITIGNGEKVCLWDIQSPFVNYRYVYVMVTRVRSLSQLVLFKYSDSKVEMLKNTYGKLLIENRIQGHVDADIEAGREVDEENYVDYDWVMERLEKQQYVSELSGQLLTIETCSIDRIDNSIGHIKSNCRLITRIENVSKG